MHLFRILFLLFFCSSVVISQPLLDKNIVFESNGESIEKTLYRLGEETNINLAFSNDIFPKFSSVQFASAKRSVRKTLDLIIKNATNVQYKVIGGQIVFYLKRKTPKKYVINGYIQDVDSGEKLIGASVYASKSGRGTTTNQYGFFSISLPEGERELSFSYLGYEKQVKTILLNKTTRWKIELKPSLTLKEVIVIAEDSVDEFSTIFSEKLSIHDLIALPGLGGENDVIRYSTLLPGVTTGADGVGGLNVRGGSVDQNLILLDDVTIYNPVHMLGVISVFNSSAIKESSLLKGRFSPRYGGRLSSVLDIRTKDGNLKKWGGEINAGLSSVGFSVEGPLVKNKSSILITGRTSPLNYFVEKFSRRQKERKSQTGFTSYKFYDVSAKVNYSFSDNDKVFLSFYNGRDTYHDEGNILYTNGNFKNEDDTQQDLKFGNTAAALRWNHLFGDRLFANTSLTYSKYKSRSTGVFNHIDTLITDNSVLALLRYTFFSSEIKDIGLKTDFDFLVSDEHTVHFGGGIKEQFFTPGVATLDGSFSLFIPDFLNGQDMFFDTIQNEVIRGREYFLYVEDEWKVTPSLKINAGIRTSAYVTNDQKYLSFEPRVHIKQRLGKRAEIHGSFSMMQQNLHLLTTTGLGLPTDLWVPSTEKIRPQSAIQGSLGFGFKTDNNWGFKLEGYYKKMNNIIEFQSFGSLIDINSKNWENNVVVGTGVSKGLEISIEKRSGKTIGMLSYTLAKSDRKFEDLNLGKPFPFTYDRRHSINSYLIHHFNENWQFSANWTFGTGLATTLPTQEYAYFIPSLFILNPIPALVFEERNSFRLPSNHRLDFEIKYLFHTKKTHQTISFGIYNVYNRKNPLYYRLGRNPDKPSESTILRATLVPIMPYFSYNIKF